VTRFSVLNTNAGSQSAYQYRRAIVPDLVAVLGIAKAAEGYTRLYQVIDEGDLRESPRKVDISFVEVLDSLASWESTQWRESRVSNRPRNPSRQPI